MRDERPVCHYRQDLFEALCPGGRVAAHLRPDPVQRDIERRELKDRRPDQPAVSFAELPIGDLDQSHGAGRAPCRGGLVLLASPLLTSRHPPCGLADRLGDLVQQVPHRRLVTLHGDNRGVGVGLRVDELPVEPIADTGGRLEDVRGRTRRRSARGGVAGRSGTSGVLRTSGARRHCGCPACFVGLRCRGRRTGRRSHVSRRTVRRHGGDQPLERLAGKQATRGLAQVGVSGVSPDP